MPTIKNFTGLNNVATDPALAGPGDLQKAVNVVVTDSKMLASRTGFDPVYASQAAVHSLNGDTGGLLYVEDDELTLHAVPTPTVLLGSLTAAATMGYYWLNNKLYFANGHETGVYAGGAVRSLGLAAPPRPAVAGISGGLTPGAYQVAVTYVRSDGQESAPSEVVYCEAPAGGLQVSGITASGDTSVIGVTVYVSGVGGEVLFDGGGLFRYAVLPNSGSSTINVVNWGSVGTGAPCNTNNTYPPPTSSTGMFFYRGRMYYIDGAVLRCSLPMMFEHVYLDRGAWTFSSNIKFALPVENGIWVGTTTEFMMLHGRDPFSDGGFEIRSRNTHACLVGGQLVEGDAMNLREFDPRGMRAIMPTAAGIYVGDGNGFAVNYTGKRWAPPSTTGAFGFIDATNGQAQYVFSSGGVVYSMNLSTGAVCKSDRVFTSMARVGTVTYGSAAAGIYADGQPDDAGTAVAVEIEKQGIDFGAGQKKSVTEIYLHAATSGTMSVVVTSDVGTGTTSTGTPVSSAMRNHKVKLARGVNGRNFTFNIKNALGAAVKLAEIEAMVAVSSRRV
jgi:hypothetical protein